MTGYHVVFSSGLGLYDCVPCCIISSGLGLYDWVPCCVLFRFRFI